MTGALILTLTLMAPAAVPADVETYLDRYFAYYPTRATAAGRHDLDERLEDLSPERRVAWVAFNHKIAERLEAELAPTDLPSGSRLDAELLLRRAQLEIFDYEKLRRPERDPLFWTGLISNATVFLLVRDDVEKPVRLKSAAARARLLPRLADQARAALGACDPGDVSPEIAEIAARQVRGAARFYAEGFHQASDDTELRGELRSSGQKAAGALEDLATFLDSLAAKATGSPRLGELYAPLFRLTTGVEEPLESLLAKAEADLVAKRAEIASYGRLLWIRYFDGDPPDDDVALVRRLFERVAQDRARTVEEFVGQYETLVIQAVAFVRNKSVVTLPDPLTVTIDRSPSYFVGQAVGGVYPAGPYSPDAQTLLYLPTPPDGLTAEELDAFFRDFNDHFNRMITPHEIVPGHYLQLKLAAQNPHKVRALFPDEVYVEGWGTFCERLLLDLGWGSALDRLAHLKKQLENIARTVVDIRVHTLGMTRDEVLAYVRDEALQDERFAANMWTRSITSAPQLTTYYLGFGQVYGLYEDVQTARGQSFQVRDFMDGMMKLGPVPVERYRERMFAP